MQLIRFGDKDHERAGAVDASGQLRDLSSLIADWSPEQLAPQRLRALQAIDLAQFPLVPQGARLGTPIAGTRQFIAIGLNYRQHAIESNMPIPDEPVVFTKAITCISGPNDDITLPPGCEHGDWEVELGIVIGQRAKEVSEADALDYVAGYVLANDVSERKWQTQHNGQWVKGKSYDSFGPLGPWLLTADALPDPQTVPLQLWVNGVQRQNSNTADMIFPVRFIVAYLSRFMTLLPGDVIITGTPEGVGMGMKPPVYLQAGDTITLSAGVLGTQTQKVL